jgi:hypothetical protein
LTSTSPPSSSPKDVAATMAAMTAKSFANHVLLPDQAQLPVTGVVRAREVPNQVLPLKTLLKADRPGAPA